MMIYNGDKIYGVAASKSYKQRLYMPDGVISRQCTCNGHMHEVFSFVPPSVLDVVTYQVRYTGTFEDVALDAAYSSSSKFRFGAPRVKQ